MSVSLWKRVGSAIRAFFAPTHVPGTIRPNVVSAGISTATIFICCLLFSPQLGLISMLGAMTTFWEADRPLWARLRNSILISAALTVSMAAGVLVAPHRWAVVPFSVLVILVVGVLYQTFLLTRGPSAVMVIYAAVIGTFFGTDGPLGWKMVGVTCVASLLTSGFLLLPLAVRVRAPERRAVEAARTAVHAFRDTKANVDSDAQRLSRDAACRAVSNAWLTLRSAWPAPQRADHRAMIEELDETQRDFARIVLERQGEEEIPRRASIPAPVMGGRPGWRYLLRHALRGSSVEWFTSWRMALAAATAGVCSQTLGIGHPYWAMMTATIVINQWTDRIAATWKAAHRTVGTLLGLIVVWAVSSAHPSPWVMAAAVIVCMIGQYLLLPLNYALALIAITPMALLAVEASTPGGNVATLISDRFVDTVIGASSAVAVTWAASWVFPRRLVRSQSARSSDAAAALEAAQENGEAFTGQRRCARVELQYELTRHLSILNRAVADDPRLADMAPAEHQVADRGYTALARSWVSPPNRQ